MLYNLICYQYKNKRSTQEKIMDNNNDIEEATKEAMKSVSDTEAPLNPEEKDKSPKNKLGFSMIGIIGICVLVLIVLSISLTGPSNSDLERVSTDVSNVIESVTTNTEAVGTVVTNYNTLTTKVGTLETNQNELTTKVGTLETNQNELTTKVGTLETKQDTLTTRVGALETSREKLRNKVNKFVQNVRKLEAGFKETKIKINEVIHTTTVIAENTEALKEAKCDEWFGNPKFCVDSRGFVSVKTVKKLKTN
jgi:hypothetical protein